MDSGQQVRSTPEPEGAGDDVYVLPTSFAQQRMWFLDRLSEGSGAYNTPIAVRLGGALDRGALTRALAGVVGRHEVLRTTFPTIDGEPVQVVAPAARVGWPVVDLSALPRAARAEESERRIAEAARTRFDLARGPLLRTALLRLAPDEHVALCTLHHIVSDGWSLEVLVRELAEGYAAALERRPPSLPPLRIQYADYAAWQRRWMEGSGFRRQLDYWREKLSGAPAALDLPTDHPRPARSSFRGAARSFRIPAGLLAAVAQLARQQAATPMMGLLAAFKVLLARYTGQTDMVVGTPISNRNRAELEPLIGFFANTVVLRTDLSGSPTFREVLRRVRQTSLEAHAHQDVPFQKVVEALRPDTEPAGNPLFQVSFNHRPAEGPEEVRIPGLTLRPLKGGYEAAKFDLQLYLSEGADGVHGTMLYRTDLFEAATIERMLRHYERLLRAAVDAPDTAVGRLPLLSDGELRQLLEEFNRPELAAAREEALRPLLERCGGAARGPGAVYVLDGELQPVPVGVWGEVCLGGPLVPGSEAGVRRTAVRGRWRADGTLEHRAAA
ncbi:MAG TPA: condensation domain-containing protein, partial [Longimicrobiaceae bacterium]|nr:condensation domain-containing protein [Longimicrobiaceae bacterium]